MPKSIPNYIFRQRILERLPTESFEDILSLAAILGGARSVLQFADCPCLWLKKDDDPLHSAATFSEILNFCGTSTLVVSDIQKQKNLPHHPLLGPDESLRFYACFPLKNAQQEILGFLHLFAAHAQILSAEQIKALEILAETCASRLEKEASVARDSLSAEQALERQNRFLDAVLENLADGIVACDHNGNLSIFNKATRQFHGLDSNQEIPPEQWAEHYSLFQADGKTPMKMEEIPLRRAFSGETIKDVEMVVVSRQGGKRTLSCNGRAMFNAQGKKLGAVLAMRDLTEVNQAYAKVEATTKILQGLIDTCPVGIAMLDLQGKVLMWNPGSEKIFGWKESEVLNKELPDRDPEHREQVLKILGTVLSTRQKVQGLCERFRQDGKKIDVDLTILPLIDEQNELYGFTALMIDVSEIKQREDNLLESNRALEAASVAKSEFLANMSHEIRTPLNGVIAMTDLLLETELKSQQREHLEIVQSSANSLLTIISDILDFSKIEAGKLEIESVEFNLLDVVEEVHETLFLAANAKKIRLTKTMMGDVIPSFKGDPGRIRQVLTNLLSNAIKFSEAGDVHTAIAMTHAPGNRVDLHIEVIDHGLGIPPDVVPRLFRAFSQADSSTTRRFGGTGLGLSICKRLMDLMGGQIGVRSQIGSGSTFWFSLPLEPFIPPQKDLLPKMSSAEMDQSGRCVPKILLAEDNMVNQIVAKELLAKFGYEVDVAANGVAVIEALRRNQYSLILMDCHMPQMDGFEATRVIRTDETLPKEITIIAVTANAMKGDREKCLDAGMDDYISKPLRSQLLQEMLQRHLNADDSSAKAS